MTKEMYKKCLNEKMEIFGKLPEDVQDEIRFSKRIECLDKDMMWRTIEKPAWYENAVYRIDPSTPHEREFEDLLVNIRTSGLYVVDLGEKASRCHSISTAISRHNCLGIIYEKDGVETLRTSVDLAFGTPKRVRFAK